MRTSAAGLCVMSLQVRSEALCFQVVRPYVCACVRAEEFPTGLPSTFSLVFFLEPCCLDLHFRQLVTFG